MNPMRDKTEGTYRGGEGTTHLWPRLVQKIAEGKTSYELSWKVKVTISVQLLDTAVDAFRVLMFVCVVHIYVPIAIQHY